MKALLAPAFDPQEWLESIELVAAGVAAVGDVTNTLGSLGPLAEADISVDMIVQNLSPDGAFTNITFTLARKDLRKHFLGAQAGLTGVNFGIAETGGVVVVTNEGNADMGTALPPLHIACMGLEKIVPRAADLSVFLRLLDYQPFFASSIAMFDRIASSSTCPARALFCSCASLISLSQ